MIGNLIHKLPTKMQTGYLVLEQIALKCLPEVERGIISSVFSTTAIGWKSAGNKDETVETNTPCAVRQCEGACDTCRTDAQLAISESSRKLSCVIVTKSYLFDQMHSHVAYHQSYAPAILFFSPEYRVTYLFQELKMCVLGVAVQAEETKSTPENSRLWMYSRC